MTRKTRLERDAEAQARRKKKEAEARAMFPARLMSALERATDLDFEIIVRNGKFAVGDTDDWDGFWEVGHEHSAESARVLDLMESELERQEQAVAEAERKVALRNSALAKLSEEEREVLGI